MNINSTAWILLLLPLLVAVTILPVRRSMPGLCALLATGAALICLVLSLALSFSDWGKGEIKPVPWIFSGESDHAFRVIIGLELDQLSRGMMIAVAITGFAVQVFLLIRMTEDDSQPFVEIALFLFAATGIIFSDGLVMLLFFTGFTGICSCVLASRWSRGGARRENFLPPQISSSVFLVGILLLWVATGSIYFREIFPALDGIRNRNLFDVAVLLLFCGIIEQVIQMLIPVFDTGRGMAKSNFPALIHGGLILVLGTYLLMRLFPLLAAAGTVAAVIILTIVVLAVLFAFRKAFSFIFKKS